MSSHYGWIRIIVCGIHLVVREDILPVLGANFLENMQASIHYGRLIGHVMGVVIPDRKGKLISNI